MRRYLYIFSNKISKLVVFMIMTFACLCSCSTSPDLKEPRILRDLVYTEDRSENQYTIFVEETGTYIPYLALTDQYEGQEACLLLRKDALDQPRAFHRNNPYASYYPDSDIDYYLNHEFYLTLSEELRDVLCSSEITVTSKESLGYCGKDTETIQRNIFLLSAIEAGGESSATVPREGHKLPYFSSSERRIVQTSSGIATSWCLRTPHTWHDNVVCGVNTEGVIGIGGIGGFGEDYLNGVRPAFCLPVTTPIRCRDGLFYLDLGLQESH